MLTRSEVLTVLEPAGYFDEAGIHSQSLVIVVAGYVARDRDWRWLEGKWKKALNEEGATCYHTTDIEADPPRGIYKGRSRPKADRLTDRVVAICIALQRKGLRSPYFGECLVRRRSFCKSLSSRKTP
jgi:hypothetical protein